MFFGRSTEEFTNFISCRSSEIQIFSQMTRCYHILCSRNAIGIITPWVEQQVTVLLQKDLVSMPLMPQIWSMNPLLTLVRQLPVICIIHHYLFVCDLYKTGTINRQHHHTVKAYMQLHPKPILIFYRFGSIQNQQEQKHWFISYNGCSHK